MTQAHTHGGFAADPAAALTVAGTGGCCGNPPQATLDLPEPAGLAEITEPAVASGPCCGTAAEAQGACCGTAARTEAVAAGAGCCG